MTLSSECIKSSAASTDWLLENLVRKLLCESLERSDASHTFSVFLVSEEIVKVFSAAVCVAVLVFL